MIYTKEFVWLHFPKCAGTKVEQLFKKYFYKREGLFQDAVGLANDPSIAWHDSIADREARDPGFSLGTRTVICSFRKLPFWLESRYNFEAQRSPDLSHRPDLLLEGKFLEADGFENHADNYVKKYLPQHILESGNVRFLRTEFFESDFKSIFGDFLDISQILDGEFKRKVNASKRCVPANVREQLYGAPEKIYKNCPYWRVVDGMVYGIQVP